MKKILQAIYYSVLGVVAAMLVLSIIPSSPWKTFVVSSGSMEPAIKTGAVVLVMSADEYETGDVITFGLYSREKPPTTHRIVEIKEESGSVVYVTRGDANGGVDMRPVNSKDVIGKVAFSIPYLGYLLYFLKTPIGFALILGIPAGIIIYDEIRKIIKEVKKKDEDN